MPRLVIFDLAGTTVQDTGHIPQAFALAFARHGLTVSEHDIARVRGASKREAVRRLVRGAPSDDDLAGVVYRTFCLELAEGYARDGIRGIAGAEETFHRLRAHDVRVALNTGLDRDIVDVMLSVLGWDEGIVDAVVCGDEVSAGRPAPDLIRRAMHLLHVSNPRDVAVVGDTVLDLEAGHHAGVRWNIGVYSGAHDQATLSTAPHTVIVASVADVAGLFGL